MNISLRNHDRLKANCAPRASLLTSTTRFWSGEKSHLKEDITSTVCRYTRHLREREGDREGDASGDECGGTDLWQSLRSLVEARKKGNPTSASLDRVQEAISADCGLGNPLDCFVLQRDENSAPFDHTTRFFDDLMIYESCSNH